jgi:hypothetical protein
VDEMIQSDLINNQQVDWDAEGWHYCLDAPDGPLTCQYIFVLDALNFCFWPTPQLEYEHLAKNLKRVLENDPTAFSASSLANITQETLASWFEGFNLPQIEERILRLQEIGELLAAGTHSSSVTFELTHSLEFGGLAENLVIQANGSAVKLVQLILRYFPGECLSRCVTSSLSRLPRHGNLSRSSGTLLQESSDLSWRSLGCLWQKFFISLS